MPPCLVSAALRHQARASRVRVQRSPTSTLWLAGWLLLLLQHQQRRWPWPWLLRLPAAVLLCSLPCAACHRQSTQPAEPRSARSGAAPSSSWQGQQCMADIPLVAGPQGLQTPLAFARAACASNGELASADCREASGASPTVVPGGLDAVASPALLLPQGASLWRPRCARLHTADSTQRPALLRREDSVAAPGVGGCPAGLVATHADLVQRSTWNQSKRLQGWRERLQALVATSPPFLIRNPETAFNCLEEVGGAPRHSKRRWTVFTRARAAHSWGLGRLVHRLNNQGSSPPQPAAMPRPCVTATPTCRPTWCGESSPRLGTTAKATCR